MDGFTGKYMSMAQYIELTNFILENHGFGRAGHHIKYIRPHFDTRTCMFYAITLQGMLGHKDFAIVNENRHRDLDQWVREFLAQNPQEAGWEPHKN